MGPLDWGIVLFVFVVMLVGVLLSRTQMKGVADFLAAGRTAGRYMLSVAGGIAGFGAITIVSFMEMNYIAGFSMSWWGLTMSVVVLIVTVSGWVIYRFRQTRCMTLAEFFERRYSRRFRIFAGIIVFAAGVVNFGIFPSVGARFFIHFCGLPSEVVLLGLSVPMFPLTMFVLLAISLFFVFAGGQIAVIVTDFVQGLLVSVVFLILTLYLLSVVGLNPLFETLEAAPKESSLINPFDTKNIPDFNFWFFLIGVAIVLYGQMGWQGTQAYNVSAKSAHEAKMGNVLNMWRGFPQNLFILLVPMLVYTVMHHASFTDQAAQIDGVIAQVGQGLEGKPLETVQNQMRAPLALSTLLPPGLLGAFAAVMFAAFVTTHDSYLHSWGSVFVQDVVMPLRKKPLSPKRHLLVLRLSIAGVAVFIFLWSLVYQLSEAIALYFAITGAIFAGGAGAVIIGGLYTRWGKARGAWAALIAGSTIATTRVLLEKVFPESFFTRDPETVLVVLRPGWEFLRWLASINGQFAAALSMGSAIVLYVAFSLIGRRSRFDLDRLLHRGVHAVADASETTGTVPSRGWRMLGVGKEFTRRDRILYVATYAWTGLQFVVFVVGTIINLAHPGTVDNAGWVAYWKVMIIVQVVISVVVIVWFTLGGVIDLRSMFRRLRTMTRDASDDGFVRRKED